MAAQYTDIPRERRSISFAAIYKQGESLDELVEVAQKADSEAVLAEVSELGILVVRYTRVPDDRPAYIDYEIVPNGHYLIYSQGFDFLYESDQQDFERSHRKA